MARPTLRPITEYTSEELTRLVTHPDAPVLAAKSAAKELERRSLIEHNDDK